MSTTTPDTASDGVTTPDVDDLRRLVELELRAAFARATGDALAPLAEAIDYSLLGPGKRIRPVLALAAAEACGADPGPVAPVAAAFELVHAYSLVHDDLPAMDDDDLRRGRPTNHRRFGEAVAVLVGDALQARAFELVAGAALPAERRIEVVELLARAAGWQGMVGGQYLDIDEGRTDATSIAGLREVHDRKTGALIAGALRAGAVAAGADASTAEAFGTFGRELGWLFQLVDDLLDETGDAASLGKTPGKDARSGKVTAVAVHGGLDGLRAAADDQLSLTLALAAELPRAGGRLSRVARFVRGRDR